MAIPTQFAYRTLKGIGIVDAAPVYKPLPGFEKPEGNSRCCTYSPCGRYFAWASNDGVTVIDASVGHIITSLAIPNVYELGFSPRGSYLITWERGSKDENGDAVKNLKVWLTVEDVPLGEEKQVVGKFVQKSQSLSNLQYTSDEKYCAHSVTNEVQFYESGDLGTVWNKLRVEGVADFAISPGKNYSVAVFSPEHKVISVFVYIYDVLTNNNRANRLR
jgi:translation initiation factor 2A